MSTAWAKGSTTRWRTFRLSILNRDRWRCTIRADGCLGAANEVDHIIPLQMGGQKYDPNNCRAACKPCNLGRKRAEPREEPAHRRVSSW